MASYDATLGMWKSKSGQYFSSQEEAQNADATVPDARGYDFLGESSDANLGGINGAAPGQASDPSQAIAWSNRNARNATVAANNAGSQRTAAALPLGANNVWDSMSPESKAAYTKMHQEGGGAGRQTWGDVLDSPVVHGIRDVVDPTYLAADVGRHVLPRQVSGAVDRAAGYANAPVASALRDIGAPDVAQVALDPLGYGRNVAMGKPSDGSLGPTGFLDLNARAPQSYNAITGQGGGGSGGSGGSGGAGGGTGGTGGSTAAPDFNKGAGRTGIDQETADARTRALDDIDTNRDENQALFAAAFDQYDNLKGGDYGLSDEARGYQREGLAQQRQLLEKMLGFDSKQYAAQFGDAALARTIAAGRSAGGGAAGQQAGIIGAMEQAPSLYAEGARQASALENQRLASAETAAKAFGDLGTMTRGQDEARAQFEAGLQKSIADSVSQLTEGNVQMNDRDSAQMAEIWMDFAKLQSVYAGMTSEEQLAWWQQETARRGQDQNFNAIMEQMKAQGKITSKDLIAGLFQLGGGLVSAGGGIGAAYVGAKMAQGGGGGGRSPVVIPNAPSTTSGAYAGDPYSSGAYA